MSTLRTNALEGMDAKNSITIVAGAGNITTTNVQEGLVKASVTYNQSSNEARTGTSFNISSFTDTSAGDFIVTITSGFSSAEFTWLNGVGGINDDDNGSQVLRSPTGTTSPTSTTIRFQRGYVNSSSNYSKTDRTHNCICLLGDLA